MEDDGSRIKKLPVREFTGELDSPTVREFTGELDPPGPTTQLPGQHAGMRSPGNIDLLSRPQVRNKDGSISTVRSMSFGTDEGEVLVPTVSDDGRIMSEQEAMEVYRRTGHHLGIFDTPQAATAYANSLHDQQDRYYQPRDQEIRRPLPFGLDAISPEIRRGIGETMLQMGTGAIAAPASGLAGIASLLTGGDAAQTVEQVGSALTFQPRTPTGQKISSAVAKPFELLERGADIAGEVTGKPSDVLGATAVKTGLLALPALLGVRARLSRPGKAAAAPPASEMPKVVKGALEAPSRATRAVFSEFRAQVGENTPAPISNTMVAARQAIEELTKQGKGQSSLVKELTRFVEANANGTTTVGILDDIAGNMFRRRASAKGGGARQVQSVIDASIKDLDAVGQRAGLAFEADLGISRALEALYTQKNLARVGRQFGKELDQLKGNPTAWNAVVRDWSTQQLEKFIGTTAQGGRAFNTQRFAQWVDQNESALASIVGRDMLDVWKAFPQWHGRGQFLKSLGQRLMEFKTGGVSRIFSREMNLEFADNIALALTDPQSPIFQALSTKRRPIIGTGGAPLVLGSEAALKSRESDG